MIVRSELNSALESWNCLQDGCPRSVSHLGGYLERVERLGVSDTDAVMGGRAMDKVLIVLELCEATYFSFIGWFKLC